jgi:hypothetical protein
MPAKKKSTPKKVKAISKADADRKAIRLANRVISDADKKAADRAGVSKRYYKEFGSPRLSGGRLLKGEVSRKLSKMIRDGKI